MLGGCRNVNITRSALYVEMVHVFHYSVTMPVVMGCSILLIHVTHACGHIHTHMQMHNRSALKKEEGWPEIS